MRFLSLLLLIALPAGAQVISVPTGPGETVLSPGSGDDAELGPGTRVVRENGRIRSIEMSGKPAAAAASSGSSRVRLAESPGKSSDQPREFEGTFGELSELDRLRTAARGAETRAAQALRDRPLLQTRLSALEGRLAAKDRELAAANPKIWRNKYNALVKEVNDLKTQVDGVESAIANAERAGTTSTELVERYLNRVRQFETDFIARKNAYLASNDVTRAQAYLNRVEERVTLHRNAVRVDRPAFERVGDHLVFRVYSLGKGPVKLMLDTGATHVVMNVDAAKRLGLKTAGSPTRLQLGNGASMEGQLVMAPELKVGDSVATRVSVVVTAVTDKMDGMDGVLGMSFLNQFRMEYTPATGTLELGALRVGKD